MENDAYMLGMGDMVDVASPSNRARIKAADLYDGVTGALDEIGEQYIEKFLRLTKGTHGRWLGFLGGHHYHDFGDGTTSDTRIAEALGAPYLGSCAFVRVKFARPNSTERLACTIWCHHGAGGGVRVSSPLNKLDNIMRCFDADIYLIGHQHKKVAAPMQQLYMTNKAPHHLGHRIKLIACTGGYLRGYLQGSKVGNIPTGSYVERFMLPPTALGGIKIHIEPKPRHRSTDLSIEVTL